jgi:hypothetical protein
MRFQVHTIFGNPGKSYEVPIGNARIADTSKTGSVAVRVDGLGKNLVFDNTTQYYANERIAELLNTTKEEISKEERVNWRKNLSRSKHNVSR